MSSVLPLANSNDPKDSPRDERRRTRRALGIVGILVGVLALILAGGVSWVLFSMQEAINRSSEGKGGTVIDVIAPAPAPAVRTNVLIAGSSFDTPSHSGAELTDSLIIASFDPDKKKTTLISVPRDLWVTSQGKGMKINAVYISAGKGEAGFAALDQVLEQVTGLHIDHNVLVGAQAVEKVVDAVGGIDVTINSTDARGIGDPITKLYLENGPQHLDGKTAMQLSRARNHPVAGKEAYGLPDSDYSRQQNQRMVMGAVVNKAKSTAFTNPLAITNMFDQLSRYTRTDITVSQAKSLAELGSRSKEQTSITIRGHKNAPLLTNYAAPDKSAAQAPKAGVEDFSEIKAFVFEALRA